MPPDDLPAETGRRRRRPPVVVAAALAIVATVALAALAGLTRGRPAGTDSVRSSTASSANITPASLPATPSPAAASIVAYTDRGYLVSLSELQARSARAAVGDQPEAAAAADLLAWAPQAAARRARPSDPLRIDGTTGPFVDDTATAYGLALAWGVSADPTYARAALGYVMAWVKTTHSLSGACASGGDCQTSLIVSRVAPAFVFAMDLLGPSGVVSQADDAAFRVWLRDLILPAASERTNNWGDAGAFLRVAATDYLDDTAGFAKAIAAWRSQLDLIAADGHIPEEVRRGTSSLSYTQEALLYKVAVARIAERRGIDLWSAMGAGGGTLRSAIDLLARSLANPSTWTWSNPVDVPAPAPLWELVEAHWPDAAYAAIVEPARPFGSDGHSAIRWTTLTNGIPLGG